MTKNHCVENTESNAYRHMQPAVMRMLRLKGTYILIIDAVCDLHITNDVCS